MSATANKMETIYVLCSKTIYEFREGSGEQEIQAATTTKEKAISYLESVGIELSKLTNETAVVIDRGYDIALCDGSENAEVRMTATKVNILK